MIAIGLTASDKTARIEHYVAEHGIRRTFVLTPRKFVIAPAVDHEVIEYEQIIMYRYYYRLLQEIDHDTLIVVNECLRTQNRSDLTYNCIRNFLQQTTHQFVFQYLPIIDTIDDMMILVDFDTRTRWRREAWRPEMRGEIEIAGRLPELRMVPIEVATDEATKARYARDKRKLIDDLGLGDPHTIPRNLHLLSGAAKLAHVDPERRYVGRNNRLKIPTLQPFKVDAYADPPYTVFEFCHNFIDFAEFLALSRQVEIPVLVSDLKVDRWYFQRYSAWLGRVRDAAAALLG